MTTIGSSYRVSCCWQYVIITHMLMSFQVLILDRQAPAKHKKKGFKSEEEVNNSQKVLLVSKVKSIKTLDRT